MRTLWKSHPVTKLGTQPVDLGQKKLRPQPCGFGLRLENLEFTEYIRTPFQSMNSSRIYCTKHLIRWLISYAMFLLIHKSHLLRSNLHCIIFHPQALLIKLVYQNPGVLSLRGGWKTAQTASFLVGSESDVRHWVPLPAGPVRPWACCFAVARAPFVSPVGGWMKASFLVGSESNVRHWGPLPAGLRK